MLLLVLLPVLAVALRTVPQLLLLWGSAAAACRMPLLVKQEQPPQVLPLLLLPALLQAGPC